MAVERETTLTESSALAGRPSGRWKAVLRPAQWLYRLAEGRLPLRWWEVGGYGVVLLAAAIMRLWDLGARAIHHDESLHAFYSWNLFRGEGYEHNPMMHGPFQFEANAAVFFIFGDGDYTARLLYALLGIALVALPFVFRKQLTRLGALLASTLLAFSPVMLYFSRFARNDIMMAAWTLGLVAFMWRYLDEGKNRYLYLFALLLALAFTTKETAYMTTVILGLFLLLWSISQGWHGMQRRPIVGVVSPPVALVRLASDLWAAFRRGLKLPEASRPASLLVLLVTLTLPQWSALISVFQDTALLDWSNLVLASPVGSAHIGAPLGGGLVVAALVVVGLLGLSVYWGFKWNWSVWWRSAAIFYSVWVLLYTTFFTNIAGVGSGIWQSLGYWTVQQGEARGNQPWYYYFVISSVYEFLPLLFGIVAVVYYLRKGDAFGQFLVYWAMATLILYTMASEKMPWLLVNVTLPLIVLSAKFLADVVRDIQWRRLLSEGGLLVLPGVPLFLVLSWQLAFLDTGDMSAADLVVLSASAGGLLGLAGLGARIARRGGAANFAAFATVPVFLVLLSLTIRTGFIASYENGDTPVEMIVYTQTSPDITRLLRQVEEAGRATGQDKEVAVTIDGASGFTWPWAWYLRDYARVSYPSYDGASVSSAPEASVILVHSRNRDSLDPVLKDLYTEGERVRHRWWFPESTYRGLTLGKFLRAFGERDTWRQAMDYFFHRKGIRDRLSSEDSYVYFSREVPLSFPASE